jgi:endonuclease/exonuclease/phosphatase family metal-dependent hydrolase
MGRQLKVMVLNAQDLFLFMDKWDGTHVNDLTEIKWNLMSSSLINNKSKEKCLSLARTILDAEADIVMVTEVGGPESLSNFSKYLLNDAFEAFSLPSNSDRGIDLGYLVRRSLPLKPSLKSHVDYILPEPARRFSRDVLRMDLKEGEETKLIFLLVHIKSKLDLRRKDFEGRSQRVMEVAGLIEIYQSLKTLNVPILIGGDFNGHAGEKDTEEEFRQIYEKTDLKDIAYLAGVPDEERFSYIYFNRGGNRFVQQIDYLFISDQYAPLLDPAGCLFPRYKTPEGLALPIPKRMEQKNILPSDHYPFLATLNLWPF